MKTYTCDKCGSQAHDINGIVGHEFEYKGFKTLSPAFRWPGVTDVCAVCFKEIQTAAEAARRDAESAKRCGFLARLGIAT